MHAQVRERRPAAVRQAELRLGWLDARAPGRSRARGTPGRSPPRASACSMHQRMQRLCGHAVIGRAPRAELVRVTPARSAASHGGEAVRSTVLAHHVERRPRTVEHGGVRRRCCDPRRGTARGRCFTPARYCVAVHLGPADVHAAPCGGSGAPMPEDDRRRVVAVGVVARGQREPCRPHPQHRSARGTDRGTTSASALDVHPAARAALRRPRSTQAAYVVRVHACRRELCGRDQAVLCRLMRAMAGGTCDPPSARLAALVQPSSVSACGSAPVSAIARCATVGGAV